jgi:hypothetical protein
MSTNRANGMFMDYYAPESELGEGIEYIVGVVIPMVAK